MRTERIGTDWHNAIITPKPAPPPPPPPGPDREGGAGGVQGNSATRHVPDGVEDRAATNRPTFHLNGGGDGIDLSASSRQFEPARQTKLEPDQPTRPVKLNAAELRQLQLSGATTFLTEDASDARVNCLDRAVDVVGAMTPAERKDAELLILTDDRPGVEGRTGHVVVRQGDAIVDPADNKRYANSEEYFKANPHYREAGTVSADAAKKIFDTPAGSPERAQAVADAHLPAGTESMLLADVTPGEGGSAPVSPSDALAEIAALDPFPLDKTKTDRDQLPAYNAKRAEIAEHAIANARRPEREDFKGLNPATAAQEYQTALDSYKQQMSQLERIRAEAKTFPTKAPDEARKLYDKIVTINDLAPKAMNDPEAARALVKELAALKNEREATKVALDEIFGPLVRGGHRDQMPVLAKKLVEAGVPAVPQGGVPDDGNLPLTARDASPLRGMLDAIATGGDPEMKALFFGAAVTTLEGMKSDIAPDEKAMDLVRDGLTNLINSKTNGVIGALETDGESYYGESLRTYLKDMLDHGKQKEIGQMVARLLLGDDLNESAIGRFEHGEKQENGDFKYANAERLGFFLGCLRGAVQARAEDTDKAGEDIKGIFDQVIGLAGNAHPAAGVASGPLGYLSGSIIDSITANIKDDDNQIFEAIRKLGTPKDINGKVPQAAAESEFQAGYTRGRGD